MLASTVQFSSNHRPPQDTPAPTHPTSTHPEGTSTTRARRFDRTSRPRPRQHPPRGCSLRTQQRAKPTRDEPMHSRSLPTASCRRTRKPPTQRAGQ